MLVRFPRASAFGLCGAIAIAANQSNFYPAPRACIACRHYAIDSNTYKPLTRQVVVRGASMPPSKV